MSTREFRVPFKAEREQPMQIVMSWLGLMRRFGQKAGPYLMLEIFLPGGTLLALLLFLYQRRRPGPVLALAPMRVTIPCGNRGIRGPG